MTPLQKGLFHRGDAEITEDLTYPKESPLCVSINSAFVSFVPLVRPDKPGCSSRLKGVCHVNSS